jgi:predicted negative regulator of RcsB-dependent stress response
MAWLELHARQVTIAVVVIAAVAVGAWLYRHMQAVRGQTASAQLGTAAQTIAAGNAALAQSDLERLVKRYPNTRAAQEGTLLLARLLYQKGSYQQGITALAGLVSSDDAALAAGAENLTAAGYEEMKKFADAAAHYQKAAALTPYGTYRDDYQASAARALTEAGKTDEARKIWTELAADPTASVSAEARVRLGQLEVTPVPQK